MVTVRKISFGVGVERTFPLHSPFVSKLEVVGRGKARRAKLYFLRDKTGKAARLKRQLVDQQGEEAAEPGTAAEAQEAAAQESAAQTAATETPAAPPEEKPAADAKAEPSSRERAAKEKPAEKEKKPKKKT